MVLDWGGGVGAGWGRVDVYFGAGAEFWEVDAGFYGEADAGDYVAGVVGFVVVEVYGFAVDFLADAVA